MQRATWFFFFCVIKENARWDTQHSIGINYQFIAVENYVLLYNVVPFFALWFIPKWLLKTSQSKFIHSKLGIRITYITAFYRLLLPLILLEKFKLRYRLFADMFITHSKQWQNCNSLSFISSFIPYVMMLHYQMVTLLKYSRISKASNDTLPKSSSQRLKLSKDLANIN